MVENQIPNYWKANIYEMKKERKKEINENTSWDLPEWLNWLIGYAFKQYN